MDQPFFISTGSMQSRPLVHGHMVAVIEKYQSRLHAASSTHTHPTLVYKYNVRLSIQMDCWYDV